VARAASVQVLVPPPTQPFLQGAEQRYAYSIYQPFLDRHVYETLGELCQEPWLAPHGNRGG
jgi:hypothetical protein